MKKIYFLALFGILFLYNSSFSQARLQWIHMYGESRWGAEFTDVYLTENQDFAVCGYRATNGETKLGWISLIDGESLDQIFDYRHGEERDYIILNSIIEVDGGGFLAAGTDSRHNEGDMVAIRVDSEGELVWIEHYGDDFGDGCKAVIELKSGSFLLGGFNQSEDHWSDGYLVEIDAEGEIIWEETYGDEFNQSINGLRETEGGYLAAGRWDYNGWLLKVNDNGEEDWSQIYSRDVDGMPPFSESFQDIISCQGGYLLAGQNGLTRGERVGWTDNFWIMKVDNDGDSIWERFYNLGENGFPKVFFSATAMLDGGFTLVGINTWTVDNNPQLGAEVVRTNNGGEINWDHRLPRNPQGIDVQQVRSVVRTRDDGAVVAGTGRINGSDRAGILMKVIPERSGPVILETTPEIQELNILVGDSIFFDVYAVDLQGDSLLYYWTLDNDSLTTDTCVTVTFDDPGEFAVECFVSDGELGDSTMWVVNASEFYLEGHSPDSLDITVRRGEIVDFSFDVAAIEGIDLSYAWTHIDRNQRQNLIGEAEAVEFTFDLSGDQGVIGEVRSGEVSEERIWQVHVRSSVYSWWPSELELSAYKDSTLEFVITPFNEESDSLEYVWLLDGEPVGSDSASVLVTFTDVGLYQLTSIVNDGGEADTIRWSVNVQEWSFTADDADLADLPVSPVLYPACPNPFNSSVNLSIYLPLANHINLSIFDIQGREVKRLVYGNLPRGKLSFFWNASDYPAGVYVVRMEAGDAMEMRKVVLVR